MSSILSSRKLIRILAKVALVEGCTKKELGMIYHITPSITVSHIYSLANLKSIIVLNPLHQILQINNKNYSINSEYVNINFVP